MPIIRGDTAPTFTLPGVTFSGLTAPSRGAEELCTWWLDVAPNHPGGAPHRLDHEEVFVVLMGTLTFSINGERLTADAGDAVSVPAHAQLAVSNATDRAARALVCIAARFHAHTAEGDIGTPPWAL